MGAPIRAISFDFDDTLWPIVPVIARAEKLMLVWLRRHCPRFAEQSTLADLHQLRLQVEAERPDKQHDFGWLRRRVLELALAPHGYGQAQQESAYQVFFQARNEVELYPDVVPALTALRLRYRLAGLSNGNADVSRIGLDEHFELTVHASEVGQLKPHPDTFKTLAQRLKLRPQQILHVGDHPQHDVEGALSAGMSAVLIQRQPGDALSPGAPVIRSLGELPSLIESFSV